MTPVLGNTDLSCTEVEARKYVYCLCFHSEQSWQLQGIKAERMSGLHSVHGQPS